MVSYFYLLIMGIKIILKFNHSLHRKWHSWIIDLTVKFNKSADEGSQSQCANHFYFAFIVALLFHLTELNCQKLTQNSDRDKKRFRNLR